MFEVLHLVTTSVIGLYAGSLLTEGFVLVPYWRRMKPENFLSLHGTMGPSLFHYFAPLTGGAVALSILMAVLGRDADVYAAGLCCVALAIFFGYFKKTNSSFADHSIKPEDLAAELRNWAAWHWVRTLIVIGAFVLSVSGHS